MSLLVTRMADSFTGLLSKLQRLCLVNKWENPVQSEGDEEVKDGGSEG